jgi:hypothetical protein
VKEWVSDMEGGFTSTLDIELRPEVRGVTNCLAIAINVVPQRELEPESKMKKVYKSSRT